MTDDDIDALLRSARDDTAPLGPDLRARILADLPGPVATGPGFGARLGGWIGGLVAMPGAALLGLWIGLAQPATVLEFVPGTNAAGATVEDTALLDDVFGTVWSDGMQGEETQ